MRAPRARQRVFIPQGLLEKKKKIHAFKLREVGVALGVKWNTLSVEDVPQPCVAGAQRKSMKFHYLAGESRNVHGVGREAHAERHGRLHAQKPGNQLLQLLVDVQVPWWARATPPPSVSLSLAPRAKLSAHELHFHRP